MADALKIRPRTRNGSGVGKWWLIVEEMSSFRWVEVYGPYPDEEHAWLAVPRVYAEWRSTDATIGYVRAAQMKKKDAKEFTSATWPIEAI